MKEHDLGTVDDLWFVFYAEVEKILRRHDITPSGWEEIAVRKTRLDGKPKNIRTPRSPTAAGARTSGTTCRATGTRTSPIASRMAATRSSSAL